MILTCPACGTRYRVDDTAIAAGGRTVRCRECRHTWLAGSSDVLVLEDEVTALPIDPPVIAMPITDENVSESVDPASAPLVTEPATEPPRSRQLVIGWAALAAAVAVILIGMGVFRDSIVSLWPPAGRLYAAIGWPVQPGFGLQLSGINVAPSVSNGQPILVLSGKIADVSGVVLPIPKLHVYLLSDRQQVLRRIETDAGKADLRPGETTSFTFNIDDPPHDATSVRVAFAVP